MNKQSSGNLAVNTIIVIVCCVAAIVTAAVFATYRFFKFYMLLADIPKKYVPIHLSDFTDKAYYEYIAENTKKCQMIYHESNKPKQPIEHDGLSNPIKEESIIPSSLVYEDVVRSVGDRARMINEVKFGSLSFRELITIHGNDGAKVVKIYEKLRFSNKAISQEEFVELLVEFVKLYR
ncbi:Dlt1 protein [Saccharomycopsis crataegensis]|uniref:Defect at low temperature protein 1 n=1 Tax=Saccharomycopsis crataegensis TaxID=43959 RepID=A0AAV5QPL2_9ASCO|nr:Dlt1 protein [Saccharomycopsis crataegensis]